MALDSSSNNVFRYVHFTPARLTDEIEEQVEADARKGELRRHQADSEDRAETRRRQRADLEGAVSELSSLDLNRFVDVVDARPDGSESLVVLNADGLAQLSNKTNQVLSSLGIDPGTVDHGLLVYGVGAAIAVLDDEGPAYRPGAQQSDSGYIQSVGTAQLEVLKQQIKRYEPGEVAHIENVIAGEKKVRRHNHLSRIEEFSSFSSETTTDTETELETTERFELNKQTSSTFKKDTELGLELTVSGKYGPTVSFDSNFKTGQTTSASKATERSVAFAKDTVERARERVIEKIAIRQERTLIREITETNKHVLKNESTDHRFAVYQYVDKIYQSQVFDYGKRLMFDFMVPEPSSFLWYLKNTTTLEFDLPEPKSLVDRGVHSPRHLNAQNYSRLGAMYGVSDLPPPPQTTVTKRLRLAHGDGSIADTGKHKSGVSGELDIPEGYGPRLVRSSILATSDETFSFSLNVGGHVFHYMKSEFDDVDLSGGHKRYSLTESLGRSIEQQISPNNIDDGEKLYVDVYGYESANYSLQMDVQFRALYNSEELEYDVVLAWKRGVYDRLGEAYENALVKYQQELAFRTAEAEAREEGIVDFGAPPAVNQKLINTELKKHCIAIIRNEHVGSLVTPHFGEPPQFDLVEARQDGAVVRFLEHAFEWSQMQYVFYPYFWARPGSDLSGWVDRMLESNPDYTMEEFLKAGYARVVVPVREGFDEAVSFFVTKGQVFNGTGEPPIDDPLYVSIIDELKERTGAGKDEIPVGEPWETRLPTAAVIVKTTNSLPQWKLEPGTDWDWKPEEA